MADSTLFPKRWAALTPNDTTVIGACMGIYVGVGGDIVASGQDDITATFKAQAGQYLSGRFNRVLATGTTATNLIALYF